MTTAEKLEAPLLALRSMLVKSASFQEWLETDEAGAAAFAHIIITPRNPVGKFVIIDFGRFSRERVAVQNQRKFQTASGSSMLLYFRDPVVAGKEEPTAALDFCNTVGKILADIELVAGQYDNVTLAIARSEMAVAPTRIDANSRDTAGDYYEAAFELEFTRVPTPVTR